MSLLLTHPSSVAITYVVSSGLCLHVSALLYLHVLSLFYYCLHVCLVLVVRTVVAISVIGCAVAECDYVFSLGATVSHNGGTVSVTQVRL